MKAFTFNLLQEKNEFGGTVHKSISVTERINKEINIYYQYFHFVIRLRGAKVPYDINTI